MRLEVVLLLTLGAPLSTLQGPASGVVPPPHGPEAPAEHPACLVPFGYGASADSSRVSGKPVRLHAWSDAEDPEITYAWSVSAGRVVGSGQDVSWDTQGVPPGSYSVTVTFRDAIGHVAATTLTNLQVLPSPSDCLQVGIFADRTYVPSGDAVTLAARVTGAEAEAEAVEYAWTTPDGTPLGTGSTLRLDTVGLDGQITVYVAAKRPGTGCADKDVTSVVVGKRRPARKVLLARRITFASDDAKVAGADAAMLRYLALRLTRAPGTRLVIGGRSEPGERSTIALERSRAAAAHLHAQGVGADRLVVRESRDEGPAAGVNPCSVDLLLLAPGVDADEVEEGCPEVPHDSPHDGAGAPNA